MNYRFVHKSVNHLQSSVYKNGTNTFNSGPPRTKNGTYSTTTTKTGPSVLRNMDSPEENVIILADTNVSELLVYFLTYHADFNANVL